MLRNFRKFSDFKKFSLDPDHIFPKPNPNEPKVNLGHKGKSDKMKAVFGGEYQSPYEKYDIQVPRTSIIDGPKPLETRLNEKDNFKKITNLYRFLFSVFALGTGLYFYFLHKSARKTEEDQKELLKNSVAKQLIYEKYSEILIKRRKEIEKLKD